MTYITITNSVTNTKYWKNSHQLSERLSSFSIMEAQLGSPLHPNTLMLWWAKGFQGALNHTKRQSLSDSLCEIGVVSLVWCCILTLWGYIRRGRHWWCSWSANMSYQPLCAQRNLSIILYKYLIYNSNDVDIVVNVRKFSLSRPFYYLYW